MGGREGGKEREGGRSNNSYGTCYASVQRSGHAMEIVLTQTIQLLNHTYCYTKVFAHLMPLLSLFVSEDSLDPM